MTDIPECTTTFQLMDVSTRTFAALTGTNPAAYPAGGVDVSSLGYIDVIGYIRQASVAENLKCIHARQMKITGFTFTYSVDGESTEEYTAEGSEKRYFAHDIIVDSGTSFPISASGSFVLTQTPIQLKNNNYLLSCIADGTYLTEGTGYTVSGTTVTFALSSAISSSLSCVYHADASMAWADISDSTVPAAIRGKNIDITISGTQMYRVQSVTIRGTFPSTRVEEMGNLNVVGYVVDPPDVTGDVSVLDTDNEIVALLATGAINGDSQTEYGITEYEERAHTLDVIIRDPANDTTVLKTVYIPQMRINSDGVTANVGGQTTYTFSFDSVTAECKVYDGARS